MHCWVKNVLPTQWIEFEVATIEYGHMQSTKFNCLVLMSRHISQAMDMME